LGDEKGKARDLDSGTGKEGPGRRYRVGGTPRNKVQRGGLPTREKRQKGGLEQKKGSKIL